ncbi:MAG: hypothetical protein GWN87_28135 [Desulfuromonadales bacterium]|nr:hypothetical protein [Desulfuromonadales bacterium]
MTFVLKTGPASEPVTLAEAKRYLKVTDTDDDDLINAMITGLREKAEGWLRRALITQTWTLWLDRFPRTRDPRAPREGYFELPVDHFDAVKREIEIPRPPLQSVTFIKTYDTADAASTFAATKYFVDTASTPGRVVLNQGESWPATDLRPANGIEIEFAAGYGTAAQVPEPIKQGLLLWLKVLMAQRSKLFSEGDETPAAGDLLKLQVGLGTLEIPTPIATLWNPYRVRLML